MNNTTKTGGTKGVSMKECWICGESGIITPGQYESKELATRQAQTLLKFPQHIYLCKECYEELPGEDKEKYEKLPIKEYLK